MLRVSVESHMRTNLPSGALCEDSHDAGTNFELDPFFTLTSFCLEVTVRGETLLSYAFLSVLCKTHSLLEKRRAAVNLLHLVKVPVMIRVIHMEETFQVLTS